MALLQICAASGTVLLPAGGAPAESKHVCGVCKSVYEDFARG
jgi:hypothetical protein